MSDARSMTMRDAFFDRLLEAMRQHENIFIVTDDFGAPALDKIRSEFGDDPLVWLPRFLEEKS